MGRRLTIALLALGVVFGYGSGIAHVIHHHRHPCHGAVYWHEGPCHGPGEGHRGPDWDSRSAPPQVR